MAGRTSIEWTEVTWNPTTGCDRTSPGCDNCYALTLAKRLKAMGNRRYQVDGDEPLSGPGFGLQCHEDLLDVPSHWRNPRTVFVNSMSDLFHPDVPLEFIQRVFETMESTPRHTFQVLTKRSKRLARIASDLPWPDNVWMGVSIENDKYTFRANHLRSVPAAVRFLSIEPMLGPVPSLSLEGTGWVIVGGESGHNCRPIQIDWVRDVQHKCSDAGTPFFFKQWGGRTPKAGGRELDGELWSQMPKTAVG